MITELHEPFRTLWMGCDPFAEVSGIKGEIYRTSGTRKTLRFVHENKGYFLKWHEGLSWTEIPGSLLRLRRPVLGATDEYEAAKKLESLGINTLSVVAFGRRGLNPWQRRSFIITREITAAVSLEDFFAADPARPGRCDRQGGAPDFRTRSQVVQHTAEIVARMHAGGVNHRDCYLCHFLLRTGEKMDSENDFPAIWLIDLHRAQIRTVTPLRWIVKDLAALWFSSFDTILTRGDAFRFIRAYTGLPLREALHRHDNLWDRVQRKALSLQRRKDRKGDSI